MFITLGFLITVVSLFLKGKPMAACLMIVGMVCYGGMMFGIGFLMLGPPLRLDLAHPPKRDAVPDWVTSPSTRWPHRVLLRGNGGECEVLAKSHFATFDRAGTLTHLEIETNCSDKAAGVRLANDLALAFGLRTALRNTCLDQLESTRFTTGGWTVEVQMWNVAATTAKSAQDGSGFRLILDR